MINGSNPKVSPTVPLDVLNALKRDVMLNMNCVQIGIIESFDSAKQTATIRMAIKQVASIAPDGTKTLRERPLVFQCPVMILYGGNSYITFPIAPGDNCIVLFNDRQIDEWLLNGGVQVPTTGRAHDFSDAIAIVGLRSFQNSIANYLANGIRLAFSADSKIELTEDLIESTAELFIHNGSMRITENLEIVGDMYGQGGNAINLTSDLVQSAGKEIHDGRMCSGTFSNSVTVVDGIVVSGT